MHTLRTSSSIHYSTAQQSDATDASRHHAAIAALAKECGAETTYVTALYERIFSELERNAKVRAFLYILTCRTVRAALRQNAPMLAGALARVDQAL
jgi:hypothetical protein